MLHLLEEFSYPLGRNKEMLKSVRKSFCICFLVLSECIFFLFLQVKTAYESWDQIIFREKILLLFRSSGFLRVEHKIMVDNMVNRIGNSNISSLNYIWVYSKGIINAGYWWQNPLKRVLTSWFWLVSFPKRSLHVTKEILSRYCIFPNLVKVKIKEWEHGMVWWVDVKWDTKIVCWRWRDI